jgi:hypothetical protein
VNTPLNSLPLTVAAPEDSSALQTGRGHHPVEAWLRTLPERKRSAILQYATIERSVVLSYLYASMLGMPVSIDEWEGWALSRFKKLDHRGIMESEIMALHGDISSIRTAIDEGKIRLGEAPKKISDLQRELRGHIEHLAKEVGVHDRRALILSGVDVVAKTLRKAFGRDPIWPALEAALESTWADIETRHQL